MALPHLLFPMRPAICPGDLVHRLAMCPSSLTRARAFIGRASLEAPVVGLKVGAPVAGYFGPTNGAPESAHLASWSECDADKMTGRGELSVFYYDLAPWRQISPQTYPAPWDINQDAAYVTPKIPGGNFSRLCTPRVNAG